MQFPAGLPSQFLNAGSSSFLDFVRGYAPEVLPEGRVLPAGQVPTLTHGTTIVAAQFCRGVVMAGDRRATMGSMIANREIEKVFSADNLSMIGVAGTAVRACVEALWDAADDDSATSGPDSVRSIWPIVAVVTASGFEFISTEELTSVCNRVIEERTAGLSKIRLLTPGQDGPGNTPPTQQMGDE